MSIVNPQSRSPCAACKFLRKKCIPECVFAPYFPPEQPGKFLCVHKVYGASNLAKILNELSPAQREDAVKSLFYEASARENDPIYGCLGPIMRMQHQLNQLYCELREAKNELAFYNSMDTEPVEVPEWMFPDVRPQQQLAVGGSSSFIPRGIPMQNRPLVIRENQHHRQQQVPQSLLHQQQQTLEDREFVSLALGVRDPHQHQQHQQQMLEDREFVSLALGVRDPQQHLQQQQEQQMLEGRELVSLALGVRDPHHHHQQQQHMLEAREFIPLAMGTRDPQQQQQQQEMLEAQEYVSLAMGAGNPHQQQHQQMHEAQEFVPLAMGARDQQQQQQQQMLEAREFVPLAVGVRDPQHHQQQQQRQMFVPYEQYMQQEQLLHQIPQLRLHNDVSNRTYDPMVHGVIGENSYEIEPVQLLDLNINDHSIPNHHRLQEQLLLQSLQPQLAQPQQQPLQFHQLLPEHDDNPSINL